MCKKLSTKITLAILLIMTLTIGTVSAVYVTNSKNIYIREETKTMAEFFGELEKINPNKPKRINSLLEKYEAHAYKLHIYDSQGNTVFSTKEFPKIERRTNLKLFDKQNSVRKVTNKAGFEHLLLRRSVISDGEKYYIYVEESLKTVDAVFDHTNRYLCLSIIFFMLVSLISIYILISRAMKPIALLNNAAYDMAQSDYSSRYEGKIYKNEIGALSKSFNNMADTIQEDIDKFKNYNFLLKEDVRRMEEYDKMRKRVLSNITHELKTPLAIISSQIEMMSCVDDGEKKKYYYDSAMEEIEKMSELISRLLNFSSGEKDIFESKVETINVSEHIKNSISKTNPLFLSKNIVCTADIDSGCMIKSVENHIDRIFNNYIINAVHYVKPNGKIKVSLKHTDSGVKLTVYNDGEKIKNTDMEKIWTDFYKKGAEEDDMTFGLGLFIVKEISIIDGCLCGVQNRENGVEFWYLFRTDNEKGTSYE